MEVVKKENLDVDKIVEALQQGKVIVYPTETVYGLGCDATNQEAVNKIFAIKKRQADKPVLVVAGDIDMMVEYVPWGKKIQELADKYWPGSLTVVSEARENCTLAKGVVGEDNTVAFRITDYPLAKEISEKLGHPLVSTSANITRQKSAYDIESVLHMFEGQEFQPDIIIDVGQLSQHAPSTIVKVSNGMVEVLRQGELIVE